MEKQQPRSSSAAIQTYVSSSNGHGFLFTICHDGFLRHCMSRNSSGRKLDLVRLTSVRPERVEGLPKNLRIASPRSPFKNLGLNGQRVLDPQLGRIIIS